MSVTACVAPRLAAFRDLPPGEVAARLDALVPVAALARSRTTDTALVCVPDEGRAVRKRWAWPEPSDRAKGAFRTTFAASSPARREFEALARLRRLDGGPFAPEPLAWAERRRGGVLHACLLLLEEVPGAVDLATFLRDESDPRARRAALGDLAARARTMHDAGLEDRELHPRNVLVAGGRTWKVDCAKQRVRGGSAALAVRMRDLAALDVGLVRLATEAERDEFAEAALGVPLTPALRARRDDERLRIDEREARRLPPTSLPPATASDNDR